MKRHWLLCLFSVALIGVLLAVKYFAGNRGAKETPPTDEVALKKLEVAGKLRRTRYQRRTPATQKHLAPEIVAKMSTTMNIYQGPSKAPDIADAYFNLGNVYTMKPGSMKKLSDLYKSCGGTTL